jgi:hypothetical protein
VNGSIADAVEGVAFATVRKPSPAPSGLAKRGRHRQKLWRLPLSSAEAPTGPVQTIGICLVLRDTEAHAL